MYTIGSDGLPAMNQDLQWTQETWDHLNGLVSDEINAGLATKLLPHYDLLGAVTTTAVPADVIVIDEHQGRIVEGKTTSIADLSAEVVLTEQQAYGGENATTIESLAIDRARRIRQGVDGVIFQGSEMFQNPLFRTLTGTVTFRNADKIVGLLDAAGGHVEVQPLDGTSEQHSQRSRPESPPRDAKKYGEHTFDAVKAAVSILAGQLRVRVRPGGRIHGPGSAGRQPSGGQSVGMAWGLRKSGTEPAEYRDQRRVRA